jgi:hypothetical protein
LERAKPKYIPARPPSALKKMEAIEKRLSPQIVGTKLPAYDPATMPIMISVLVMSAV